VLKRFHFHYIFINKPFEFYTPHVQSVYKNRQQNFPADSISSPGRGIAKRPWKIPGAGHMAPAKKQKGLGESPKPFIGWYGKKGDYLSF
jgi:hypothetical protein